MGHCARKVNSLATARASDVLTVLTHFDYSPIHKAPDPVGTEVSRCGTVRRIRPISGKRVPRTTKQAACFSTDQSGKSGD
jgi:hypothetical protein